LSSTIHNKMQKFVSYLRVSTDKQGVSGLGIEAQREIIRKYTEGRGHIIHEFTEFESGKMKDRPQLADAIKLAKDFKATLIIAKLDRLSRSVSFIFALKDQGIDFICADMPEMNTMTLGIFAVIAQAEREKISINTSEALQAKKRRGEELGTYMKYSMTDEQRALGRAKATETKRGKNATTAKAISELRQRGLTYSEIRDTLYIAGVKTKTGKPLSLDTISKYAGGEAR